MMQQKRPDLQLYLPMMETPLADETGAGAVSVLDEQAMRLAAVSFLHPSIREKGLVPEWWDGYLMLRDKGWDVRKAAYIAWASVPKQMREPRTLQDFAVKVLMLTSDRVIHTWRKKNPTIEEAINQFATAEMWSYRSGALRALGLSASTVDYKHHPDRKLLLEITGDYVPVRELRALLRDGKLNTNRDIENMSDEELDAGLRKSGIDFLMMGDGELVEKEADGDAA